MGKKKGHKGQKKVQGQKAKSIMKAKKVAKANLKTKGKKAQSKAVKTNLKKMAFSNTKKIESLNADIVKVLTAPSKVAPTLPPSKQASSSDAEMPDVSGLSSQLSSM